MGDADVDPPLEQPPVSLTLAMGPVIDSPVKPVARDCWRRRPDAYSASVGSAKSLSITSMAGLPGSTRRRTAVTYGWIRTAYPGGFSEYTFLSTV